MIHDPEQIRDERRELLRPERPATPAAAAASTPAPWPTESQTLEMLAKLRGQEFDGRRWLCIARSDRRPSSSFELARVLREIAKAEGVPLEVVRDSVDGALQAEQSDLATWSALLDRPRPSLGRGLGAPRGKGVAC